MSRTWNSAFPCLYIAVGGALACCGGPTPDAADASDVAPAVEIAPSDDASDSDGGDVHEASDAAGGADAAGPEESDVTDASDAPAVVPDVGPETVSTFDPCVSGPMIVDWSTALPREPADDLLFDAWDTVGATPDLTALAVSVGDVTGDGRPDIVVGALEPQLLVNCGDAGLVSLPLPPMFQAAPVSTLLLDLDDDGDVDVLYGGGFGSVQVIRQTAPLVFEAEPPLLTSPDEVRPTVNSMAVVGDLIHLGQIEFPPLPVLDPGSDADAANFEIHKEPNRTLRIVDGQLELLPREAHDDAADTCWDAPTFASLVIARHQMDKPDLLFEGNDFGPDCLSEIGEPDQPLFPLLPVGGAFGDVNATMGADYYYEGDRVMLVSTDFVDRPHLWSIGDGVDVVGADDRFVWVDHFGYRITWGAAFEDFDGDGDRDLLIAHAAFVFEDPDLPEDVQLFLESVAHGGAMLLLGDGLGSFIETPEKLPALDGAFYGAVVGDFHGADGHGDGCPDVVLTTMVAVPAPDAEEGALPTALTTTRLLVCRPTHSFAGVRLPHARWASRAVVAMETTSGDMLWEPIRSSAGVAGSRDAVARFTVHAAAVPARFHVHLGDGSPQVIEAPKLGTYATLPHP